MITNPLSRQFSTHLCLWSADSGWKLFYFQYVKVYCTIFTKVGFSVYSRILRGIRNLGMTIEKCAIVAQVKKIDAMTMVCHFKAVMSGEFVFGNVFRTSQHGADSYSQAQAKEAK